MGEVQQLGKYQILSTLGQGAMGVVYKAFDPHIERTVALKTIRKDALSPKDIEPLLTRFKHEAQAAGRLTHSGIVTVYEYGEDGNNVYIAMEFVQGQELKEILDRNAKLPLATSISLINQLLDALEYSHAHGVVHRDIKPGNIILLDDGRIKVTDFGIAKIESSTLTQFGDVIGTPSYMSPEQFGGQVVDRRSDLFSAGVILYHLLTGEKPFPGNSMTTIMHRVLNTIPPNVSELNFQVPSCYDPVVAKALAKKPDNRFQTAKEFKAALEGAQDITERRGNDKGEDADLTLTESDEETVSLVDEAATSVTGRHPRLGITPDDDLHQKVEKIVGLLENQGLNLPQEDNLYRRGRNLVMAFLVLVTLALCSYGVWIIYTEDLTYDDLELYFTEKVDDLRNLISGREYNEDTVPELTDFAKKKPETPAGSGSESARSGQAVPVASPAPHPPASSPAVPDPKPPPDPNAAGPADSAKTVATRTLGRMISENEW